MITIGILCLQISMREEKFENLFPDCFAREKKQAENEKELSVLQIICKNKLFYSFL